MGKGWSREDLPDTKSSAFLKIDLQEDFPALFAILADESVFIFDRRVGPTPLWRCLDHTHRLVPAGPE
jgi:hypothetical protein